MYVTLDPSTTDNPYSISTDNIQIQTKNLYQTQRIQLLIVGYKTLDPLKTDNSIPPDSLKNLNTVYQTHDKFFSGFPLLLLLLLLGAATIEATQKVFLLPTSLEHDDIMKLICSIQMTLKVVA